MTTDVTIEKYRIQTIDISINPKRGHHFTLVLSWMDILLVITHVEVVVEETATTTVTVTATAIATATRIDKPCA
jgi:hypothetical protein